MVPNGHLAAILLRRAFKDNSRKTMISTEGPEGSYLLETLTIFVCDRVANGPFERDLYVMAPCCEPAEHQPIADRRTAASRYRVRPAYARPM